MYIISVWSWIYLMLCGILDESREKSMFITYSLKYTFNFTPDP
jgi:hypothetical protein